MVLAIEESSLMADEWNHQVSSERSFPTGKPIAKKHLLLVSAKRIRYATGIRRRRANARNSVCETFALFARKFWRAFGCGLAALGEGIKYR